MKITRGINRLVRKAGELRRDLVFKLSGTPSLPPHKTGDVRVLVYHGVVPADPFRFNTRFISCALFEEHLQLFKKHCHLISFDDYKSGRFAPEKLNLLITFDDGYLNNFQYALPLLKKYEAPAVFFVTARRGRAWLFNDVLDVFPAVGPGEITLKGIQFALRKVGRHHRYVDKNNISISKVLHALSPGEREKVLEDVFNITPQQKFLAFSQYLDLMDDHALKQLGASPAFTLGAHGGTHADLSMLSSAELEAELAQCLPFSPILAFPYGRYTAGVLNAGTKAGFRDFFGTEHLDQKTESVSWRLTVNPFVSAPNELYYIIKGNHE